MPIGGVLHLIFQSGISNCRIFKVTNCDLKRAHTDRFPADFMFQLDEVESAGLRSQSATLKSGRGGHRKYLPYVFTEQGVAMLSSVLKSDRAVQVNIAIMRAFVLMRELATSNRELAGKFAELERRVGKHDDAIRALFDAIGQLMTPVVPKRNKIGFGQKGEGD